MWYGRSAVWSCVGNFPHSSVQSEVCMWIRSFSRKRISSIHGNWLISSTNLNKSGRSYAFAVLNCWPFRARYLQLGQLHFHQRAATHNFFLENLLADAIGIQTVYFQGKVSREDLKMCYSVLHWCKSWLSTLHNWNNSTWPCVFSWSAMGFDETLTLHWLLIKSKEE